MHLTSLCRGNVRTLASLNDVNWLLDNHVKNLNLQYIYGEKAVIAGTYNILCEQGTTFVRVLELQTPNPLDSSIYEVYDLSGHTARMQIRRTIDSSSVMIELTTENGGIEIDGDEGKITILMSDTQTGSLTSSGVYDLEIEDNGGNVSRVVQGTFTLSQEVTR